MGLPGGSAVKNLPSKQETRVRSLGQEDPLKKGMATHSSILAWRIPRTAKPGRLWFMGSQRVGHDWATEMDWMYTSIKIWIPWWQDLCLGLVDIVIFPSYCVSLFSHTLFENCSVFCCCSVAKLFPNLCDFMDCSTPGSSVLHCLLEFAHIHVHWVVDAI